MYKRVVENFKQWMEKTGGMEFQRYNEEGDVTDINKLKSINEMEKYLETDLNIIKVIIEASDSCLIDSNIE